MKTIKKSCWLLPILVGIFLFVFLGITGDTVYAEKKKNTLPHVVSPDLMLPNLNKASSSNVFINTKWGAGWKEQFGLEEGKWQKSYGLSGTSWNFTYAGSDYIGNLRTNNGGDLFNNLEYTITKKGIYYDEYSFLFSGGYSTQGIFLTGTDDDYIGDVSYYRQTLDVYQQKTKNGQMAIQQRGVEPIEIQVYDSDWGWSNELLDIPIRTTYIPQLNGSVLFFTEIQNIEGEAKNYGLSIGYDTDLRNDRIPIFNIDPFEGIYMNSEEDEFKILIKQPSKTQVRFNNYEAHAYYNYAYFLGGRNGSTGHEAREKDALLLTNTDSGVAFKWNVASVPPNYIRQMGIEYALRTVTPPIFTLNEKNQRYQINQKEKIHVSGTWKDLNSTKAQLYMKSYPRGTWSETVLEIPWKLVNEEDDFFENPVLNTDKNWEMDINGSDIGEPSYTEYQVDFCLRDSPEEDFSKETHSIFVNVMPKGLVETVYLDQETGKPLVINGNPVLSKKDYYDYGSRYTTNPENFEANDYYYTGKKTATSDPEKGTINSVANRKVEYLYEKAKVTLNISHVINNDLQNTIKKEKVVLGFNEPYQIDALPESETMSKNVVWDEVVPPRSFGTTGNQKEEIDIVFNYVTGTVKVVEATPTINFGNNLFIQALPSKRFSNGSDLKIKVKDQRRNKATKWRIGAKVLKELTATESGQVVQGAFQFASIEEGREEYVLQTDDFTEVYVQKKASTQQVTTETEITWNGLDKEGLFINTQPGQIKKGSYSGEIEWAIVDGL